MTDEDLDRIRELEREVVRGEQALLAGERREDALIMEIRALREAAEATAWCQGCTCGHHER